MKLEKENIFELNKEVIENHINSIIEKFNINYTLEETDVGKYSSIDLGQIKFNVKQYRIKGVGNLLILDSKESQKMQVVSIAITPYYKNLPLFSTDYIYVQEKRNIIIEYYDLVSKKDKLYLSYLKKFQQIKDKYKELKDISQRENWYHSLMTVSIGKNTDINNGDKIEKMFFESLKELMQMEKESENLTEENKKVKWNITKDYVDKLLKNGGVSTNLFKGILGEEETNRFFYKVFFGLE